MKQVNKIKKHKWFYGVTVSTLDFESIDPSSNLGRTSFFQFCSQKSNFNNNKIKNIVINKQMMQNPFINYKISSASFRHTSFKPTRCQSSIQLSPQNRDKIKEISESFHKGKNPNTKKFPLTNTHRSVMNSASSSMITQRKKDDESILGINKLYASLIEEEKRTTAKKKRIKGKLIKMLKSKIVLNKEMFKNYDNIFHPENDKEKIKIRLALLKKQKAKEKKIKSSSERNHLIVKSTPDFFSSVKVSFRYEDLYLSPEEILGNYFSKEEIDIMKLSPKYFNLNRPPFKGSQLKLSKSLSDIINKEENQKMDHIIPVRPFNYKYLYKKNTSHKEKQKKQNSIDISTNKKNSVITSHFISKSAKNKSLVLSSSRSMRNSIRKKTMDSDFDLNPNDPFYSSYKYEKIFDEIEKRKEYTLMKRQDNLNYKKEKFEFLKNQHIKSQKQHIEDMYQAREVIKQIEKNYIHRGASHRNSMSSK